MVSTPAELSGALFEALVEVTHRMVDDRGDCRTIERLARERDAAYRCAAAAEQERRAAEAAQRAAENRATALSAQNDQLRAELRTRATATPLAAVHRRSSRWTPYRDKGVLGRLVRRLDVLRTPGYPRVLAGVNDFIIRNTDDPDERARYADRHAANLAAWRRRGTRVPELTLTARESESHDPHWWPGLM